MFDSFQTKLIFFPNFSIIIGMWRKVKTFLHIFTGSIVPHSFYYSKILKTRFQFSLQYFLFLLMSISIISVIILGIKATRYIRTDYRNCLSHTYGLIPPNYSMEIQNGILSTNSEMPLLLWFNCNNSIRLLGVIDERATEKSASLYGAHILVTGTNILFKYKTVTHSVSINQYVNSAHFSKEDIVGLIQKSIAFLNRSIPYFVLFLLVMAPFFLFFFNTILGIVASFMVFGFFKLFGKKYHFTKILQIGFHSYTFPLIASLLFILFPVHVFNILLLSFSLFFVFQLTAVYEAHYITGSTTNHSSNK